MAFHSKKDFDDYFRAYYRALCYFARRYLKDPDLAEDTVQEVFVRILEEKMTFQSEEHLRRFLYTAVRNSCLNQKRLTEIHENVLNKVKEESPDADDNLFNGIVRSEVYRLILKAVEELPTECGRIFRMAYIEGLDNEEIAAQLGISVNTVKVQKNKAKIRLREKLKDLYPLALLLLSIA